MVGAVHTRRGARWRLRSWSRSDAAGSAARTLPRAAASSTVRVDSSGLGSTRPRLAGHGARLESGSAAPNQIRRAEGRLPAPLRQNVEAASLRSCHDFADSADLVGWTIGQLRMTATSLTVRSPFFARPVIW